MDKSVTRKPMPMAELLPEISALLPEDARIALRTKKKAVPNMVQKAATTGKVYKPMKLAEIFNHINAFKPNPNQKPTPKREVQYTVSNKKRCNPTIRVEKGRSTIRKVLDFQPKPQFQPPKAAGPSETPRFPKPEFKGKKSNFKKAPNAVRISGICNIQETPATTSKPLNGSRMTLATNYAKSNYIANKPVKRIINPPIPVTPITNKSWKSSCDESFLQKEMEINNSEQRKGLDEKNANNITALVTTQFTKHREYITEYFDNSSNLDDSAAYRDNTIMCFDKPSNPNTSKREDSVIVSLCDLLHKATIEEVERETTLDELLSTAKRVEQNLSKVEHALKILNEVRQSDMQSLELLRKLIMEKRGIIKTAFVHKLPQDQTDTDNKISDTKVENDNKPLNIQESAGNSLVTSIPCSVIKSRMTPSYKVPKRSPSLKRKAITKSLPNKLNETPNKDMNEHALNMYMEMKQHMNFLNTPLKRHQTLTEPDTPAVTSHNLQLQLEKLYGEC